MPYCRVPFEYMEIVNNGNVHLCCAGRMPTAVGNILDNDLETIWHGYRANQVREEIRSQTFASCTQCRYLDWQYGRVTKRPVPYYDKLEPPREIWLLLDRTCQLACGSCRKSVHVANAAQHALGSELLKRVLDEPFLKYSTLWLDGSGEATVSPVYRDFPWRTYEGHGYGLLTNGLNLPNIKPYKMRELRVSLDAAFYDTYERLRGGSHKQWHTVQAALKRASYWPLDDYRHIMTVQAENFAEIPQFADYARMQGAVSWFTALTNWGTYTPEEFASRAIHFPSHPRHHELLEVLNKTDHRGVIQWVVSSEMLAGRSSAPLP